MTTMGNFEVISLEMTKAFPWLSVIPLNPKVPRPPLRPGIRERNHTKQGRKTIQGCYDPERLAPGEGPGGIATIQAD